MRQAEKLLEAHMTEEQIRTYETELARHMREETRIPDYMHAGITDYITAGVPVGSFLSAVLEGDLHAAAREADGTNRHLLWDYALLLHNHAPMQCYGSPQTVADWERIGGLICK